MLIFSWTPVVQSLTSMLVLLTVLAPPHVAMASEVDEYNIPDPIRSCLQNVKDRDFDLSARLNPFYLRGDFNGDKRPDHAALITQRTTKKEGVIICFGGKSQPQKLGAGNKFTLESGTLSDDFVDFDSWKVYDDVERHFRTDAIHLIAKESGSGVIYWDGKKLRWEQLGI